MSVVFLVPCVASASSTVDLLSQEIVYGADVTENTAIKKLNVVAQNVSFIYDLSCGFVLSLVLDEQPILLDVV